jgi:hypothetical protein
MKDIKIGDKIVCIVNNHHKFAPCEVVEVEDVFPGGLLDIKGYTGLFDKMLFRKL